MHRKIREQHNLAVPRDLVYDMMTLFDPEGLERRGNVGKRKRQRTYGHIHLLWYLNNIYQYISQNSYKYIAIVCVQCVCYSNYLFMDEQPMSLMN